MTKYLIVLLSLFLFFSCTVKNTNEQKNKISYETYEVNNGWGYKILLDGKPFINQEIIPGITGQQSFSNQEDAAKIAELVIEKIKQRKTPSIDKKELEQLGIDIPKPE